MVRAQARGVIDWAQHDPRSFADHQRARLLIREMVEEEKRELRKARFLSSLATKIAVGANLAAFGDEKFKEVQEQTIDALDALYDAYWPWEAQDRESRKKQEAATLIESWESRWGSLDDPSVQSKMQEVADAMMRMADATGPATPYQGTIYNRNTAGSMPLGGR